MGEAAMLSTLETSWETYPPICELNYIVTVTPTPTADPNLISYSQVASPEIQVSAFTI